MPNVINYFQTEPVNNKTGALCTYCACVPVCVCAVLAYRRTHTRGRGEWSSRRCSHAPTPIPDALGAALPRTRHMPANTKRVACLNYTLGTHFF